MTERMGRGPTGDDPEVPRKLYPTEARGGGVPRAPGHLDAAPPDRTQEAPVTPPSQVTGAEGPLTTSVCTRMSQP